MIMLLQLFADNVQAIDVTQISGTGSHSGEHSAKRRRLESGWEAIRNIISTAGQSPKIVPW